jgi:hypothetical protein
LILGSARPALISMLSLSTISPEVAFEACGQPRIAQAVRDTPSKVLQLSLNPSIAAAKLSPKCSRPLDGAVSTRSRRATQYRLAVPSLWVNSCVLAR